jgi:hypothetical protein
MMMEPTHPLREEKKANTRFDAGLASAAEEESRASAHRDSDSEVSRRGK